MAKFKCKHSGCVYEWFDEEAIKVMRAHSEYTEEPEQVAIEAKEPKATPVKKQAKE